MWQFVKRMHVVQTYDYKNLLLPEMKAGKSTSWSKHLIIYRGCVCVCVSHSSSHQELINKRPRWAQ